MRNPTTTRDQVAEALGRVLGLIGDTRQAIVELTACSLETSPVGLHLVAAHAELLKARMQAQAFLDLH